MQDNEPFIMKKRRKVRHMRWGRIVFALFLVCTAVIIFVVIASAGKNQLSYKSKNYYFVQTGEFTNGKDAAAKSLEIQNSGGSGYMLNGDKWRVMAAVYAVESEAGSVVKKLNAGGKNAVIYRFTVPELKLDAPKSKAESVELSALLKFPLTVFDELYTTCIQLDKGEISESLALLHLKTLSIEMGKLYDLYAASEKEGVKKATVLYGQCYLSLEGANSLNSLKTGVRIKYALCDYVRALCDGYSAVSK